MKRTLLIILGIYASLSMQVYAQNTSSDGIEFFTGTWQEVLAEAKNRQKLIFVDVYATWCGPCKMMERNVFRRGQVGEFFNDNFINYRLDGETDQGPRIARQYGVTGYPYFLFVDYQGELIHSAGGYFPPQDFLQVASRALSPENKETTLALRYRQGTASPEDLLEYALIRKKQAKSYENVAKEYFSTQEEKDLFSKKNWNAIKELSYNLDGREFKLLLEKQKKFKRLYGEREVNDKIAIVCKKNTIAAGLTNDHDRYLEAMNIVRKYVDDKGELASKLRVTYAESTKSWDDYSFKAISHFEKYPSTNAEELTHTASRFLDHVPELRKLEKAEKWVRQAVALSNSIDNNMLHARLLKRINKPEDARKAGYRALNLAYDKGKDTDNIQAFLHGLDDSDF